MIKTTAVIMDELKNYKFPAGKLQRLVKQGIYIPIVHGLYENDSSTPGYLLAGSIYGPSYLSFEFALAQHGLIPEAVYAFTCATYNKKKTKKYQTPFGLFTYMDVPANAYTFGLNIIVEGEYSYILADAEKALCDQLYKIPTVSNNKELESLLFDDLRIDEHELKKMNGTDIEFLSSRYGSTNVKRFNLFMRRFLK